MVIANIPAMPNNYTLPRTRNQTSYSLSGTTHFSSSFPLAINSNNPFILPHSFCPSCHHVYASFQPAQVPCPIIVIYNHHLFNQLAFMITFYSSLRLSCSPVPNKIWLDGDLFGTWGYAIERGREICKVELMGHFTLMTTNLQIGLSWFLAIQLHAPTSSLFHFLYDSLIPLLSLHTSNTSSPFTFSADDDHVPNFPGITDAVRRKFSCVPTTTSVPL